MATTREKGIAGNRIPWRMIGWGTAGTLLLVPLAAMQFTGEVNWTVSDFIFAGAIFAVSGGIFELAVWKSGSRPYRTAVAIAIAAAFLHLWITGAVGIIGDESNPGNLLYLAVVAAVVLGSMAALGRARAMSWVMGMAAIAELMVPLVAYAGLADPASDVLKPEVLASAALFAGTWTLSAWLFRKADRDEA